MLYQRQTRRCQNLRGISRNTRCFDLSTRYPVADSFLQRRDSYRSDSNGEQANPTYHEVVGLARGLAVGMGSDSLNDEHRLLALVYGERGGDLLTTQLDGDDVLEGLQARGVPVPTIAPPLPTVLIGPWGNWVYFPGDEFAAVSRALLSAIHPGQSSGGPTGRSGRRGTGTCTVRMRYRWRRSSEGPCPIRRLSRFYLTRKDLAGRV